VTIGQLILISVFLTWLSSVFLEGPENNNKMGLVI
jgi:hypothetical protein